MNGKKELPQRETAGRERTTWTAQAHRAVMRREEVRVIHAAVHVATEKIRGSKIRGNMMGDGSTLLLRKSRRTNTAISAIGNRWRRRNARDVRVFGRIQGDTKEKWWEKEDGLENVATVTTTENFIEQLVRQTYTMRIHGDTNAATYR